ncbi:MAG: isoprenoid biosynthesis glyoxalase ElbB [candidate division Zixibacteria bacterium]|nr:isoprenoid biosynthesis glyoxalase ElbB [candidate division Zixibacteria bacterium]
MKKVAVILAGSGVYDGSEIHEAALTLLYLDKVKAEIKCFAPDKNQLHVINHLQGEPVEGENRNVLLESARIARGEVLPLPELKVDDFDAVIFPGGFGAAKNLCTFAVDGPDCEIDGDVNRIVNDTVEKKKVLGVICISPVIAARALKDSGRKPKLTVGTDKGTMEALEKLNAEPVEARVNEIVVDENNKIVSTPAYMLGPSIAPVAEGIEKLVNKVIDMA